VSKALHFARNEDFPFVCNGIIIGIVCARLACQVLKSHPSGDEGLAIHESEERSHGKHGAQSEINARKRCAGSYGSLECSVGLPVAAILAVVNVEPTNSEEVEGQRKLQSAQVHGIEDERIGISLLAP